MNKWTASWRAERSEAQIDWASDHGTGGIYATIIVEDNTEGPDALTLADWIVETLKHDDTHVSRLHVLRDDHDEPGNVTADDIAEVLKQFKERGA